MAKVTITIRNVAWRDGRPRFVPGPAARKLGLKGQDLKGPDGRWMSAEEAAAWVGRELSPRLDAAKQAKAAGKRLAPAKRPGVVTVSDLFDKLWDSPKFAGGRDGRKVLALRTLDDYRKKADSLAAFDPEFAAADIRALTKPVLIGLHEALWTAKGHHMANAVLAVLRLALTYAVQRAIGGLTVNPALQLGLETPKERLRVGSLAEMTALLAAADAIGLSMIGHCVMLGLMTGQRQGDRLALQDVGHEKGWRRFRQGKTGALVEVPETPGLTARLANAKAERERLGCKVVSVIVDPRTRLAFDEHSYRKEYAKVRAAAVAGVKRADGSWLVEPCPTLDDFRESDTRDTAVTWLARAGCSVPEIRAITGHDLETVHKILKHYLAIDREQASSAIGKLVTYLEAKGAAL